MGNKDLKKELERLRRKLSPLEDPEFTEFLQGKMKDLDLSPFQRSFRRAEYIVVTPGQIAELCGLAPLRPTITNIGRSLQALCWERSALHGQLVFVMSIGEYHEVH